MGEGLTPPCSKIVLGQQQLTPAQEAYAREFARKRLTAMLPTGPIDEREVEKHLRAAYQAAGYTPPTAFRWFNTSDDLVTLRHAVVNFDSIDTTIQFLPNLVNDEMDRVRRSVSFDLYAEVRDIIHSVRSRIYQDIENEILRIPGNGIVKTLYGSECHLACANAALLAISGFFHEVLEENTLIHATLFNENVLGYLLRKRESWLVRKPLFLVRDEQRRLHNASGPCLLYSNGRSRYAWHGVDVSEKLIMHPEQVTREDWITERNMEVRRAIQERLGSQRFVELVGGKQIDIGKRGKLIEIDLGRRDPERIAHYVQVQDSSTERQYYLRVPPSINGADEAIAWTFGMNARDYQLGQET